MTLNFCFETGASTMEPRRTPLCDEHIKLGGRMVDFAGWYMPVQYIGIREEHDNVRKNVGLFDVSHMGEIRVRGPKALETVEWFTTNDVSKLEPGQAQYTLLPNETGGLVDDLIVYCIKKNEEYFICVNASNKDKDFEFMKKHNRGAEVIDESNQWAQIAVQGPKALALVQKTMKLPVADMKPFTFQHCEFEGAKAMIATTGYTGEKGVEIFVDAPKGAALWSKLYDDGKEFNVMAIGLGARDTLRTEMKYSLYGHEIDDTTNPYEAGLGWVIKPQKKDFIGKAQILGYREKGLKSQLVGFKMDDKGIPRQGYALFSFDNKEIGKVTSGTVSPSLNEPIGIGYVTIDHAAPGTQFYVDIRGRKAKAKVVPTPFVKPGV